MDFGFFPQGENKILSSGWPLVGVLLLVCFFLVLFLHWSANDARTQAKQLQAEIEAVLSTNQRLEEENKRFSLQLSTLKTPENLARTARDDLGMIRPGEVVFFVAQ